MDQSISVTVDGSRSFSKTGLLLVSLTGGAAVALSVVCLPFVSPALRRVCLPYVPATSTQVSNVLTALSGRSGRLVDLGSGDGRIVLSAAEAGFFADGIELNPWLVWYSRLRAYRLGLRSKTSFHCQDLWKTNLTPYHNVVIFGVQEMMPELEAKLLRELREDACVVACRFPFISRTPDVTLGSGIDTGNWKPYQAVMVLKEVVEAVQNKHCLLDLLKELCDINIAFHSTYTSQVMKECEILITLIKPH